MAAAETVDTTALSSPAVRPRPVPAQWTQLQRDAQRGAAAVVLARDRSLPVLPALQALLPEGMRRGAVMEVGAGPGATSLALALTAGASAQGSWVAVVGAPSLGLSAAADLGV